MGTFSLPYPHPILITWVRAFTTRSLGVLQCHGYFPTAHGLFPRKPCLCQHSILASKTPGSRPSFDPTYKSISLPITVSYMLTKDTRLLGQRQRTFYHLWHSMQNTHHHIYQLPMSPAPQGQHNGPGYL